jgi:hypothetical protein
MKGKLKFVVIGILILSIVCATILVRSLYKNETHTEVLGMVWELTHMVKENDLPYLRDELSKYGDMDEAVTRYHDYYANAITWDNNPPFPADIVTTSEPAAKIRGIYFSAFLKYPLQFVGTKLHFGFHALGIGYDLVSAERGIHYVDSATQRYGAADTEISRKVRDDFIKSTDKLSAITLKPAVFFAMTLIFLAVFRRLNKAFSDRAFFMVFIAGAYYIAFCLNNQAYEFRYYAPSFFILLCVCMGLTASLLFEFIKFMRGSEH